MLGLVLKVGAMTVIKLISLTFSVKKSGWIYPYQGAKSYHFLSVSILFSHQSTFAIDLSFCQNHPIYESIFFGWRLFKTIPLFDDFHEILLAFAPTFCIFTIVFSFLFLYLLEAINQLHLLYNIGVWRCQHFLFSISSSTFVMNTVERRSRWMKFNDNCCYFYIFSKELVGSTSDYC